jgi:hypothetical protein
LVHDSPASHLQPPHTVGGFQLGSATTAVFAPVSRREPDTQDLDEGSFAFATRTTKLDLAVLSQALELPL